MSASAIYVGSIAHARLRPERHGLRYRALYLLLDLDELPALARRLRLFSLDRFNIFSFRNRDHLAGSDVPLREQIEQHLRAADLEVQGGRIALLCMPSVLGSVFNPLSIYFCHRRDGLLQALLYEVNNTFGERHSYLIPVRDVDVLAIRQTCAKEFYVSPFMEMALTYHFRVTPPAERLSVQVSAHDGEGPVLAASLMAERVPLTDGQLLRAFLRHPLLALQVLAGIHWEALKLWRKGISLKPRPAPPAHAVSLPRAARQP